MNLRTLGLGLALTTLPLAAAHAQILGPSVYTSSADSPFGSVPDMILEDFENGLLDTPGVAINAGWVVSAPNPFNDSVDGDDGLVDGVTTTGRSLYSGNSQFDLIVTFDRNVLGSLPTHAGIVFTDIGNVVAGSTGFGKVLFTAYDADGAEIGNSGLVDVGDGTAFGAAGDDRFFGVIHAAGIGSFKLATSNSADWEVDHLQYNGTAAVPEPESVVLMVVGGLLLAGHALLRRGR